MLDNSCRGEFDMTPELRERLMTPVDASRQQLQRGVFTALLHIASVRDAGARPLAIEFSAALDEVRRAVNDAAMADELKQCFGNGLPLQLLKVFARHHVAGVARLPGLEPDALRTIDSRYRNQYLSLVIAAAEAALKVEIDEGPYRRRGASRWERSALEDIRRAVRFDE
jgi:hypothetical protein